jgi:hypothetical protein
MALSFVAGSMLNTNLVRDSDLAFNTNLLYIEYTGNRIGVNTVSPTEVLDVVGNVLVGNVKIANIGTVSAAGNITGGNILTSGIVSATGNLTGGNITLSANTVVSTNGNAILFTGTAGVGVPVGNTTTRPSPVATGTIRFNTTLTTLEVYNGADWQSAGGSSTVAISDQQFSGDGVTTTFTLNANATSVSVFVTLNGVGQLPGGAYDVIGNTALTFNEAPASGDAIDVRFLASATTTTALTNASGNAAITVSPTSAVISATGNLIPSANSVFNLGNSTNNWNSLYLSGNTIYLGPLQLQALNANTFVVYQSDGVTQANIDVGNIDVSSIVSGNSTIGISGSNGNAYFTVRGTANVLVASNTGVAVSGILSATGNITGGNVNTAGLITATGNVTGGNISTAGLITATGNVTGGNISTAGLITATSNITGGNVLTGGLISATGNISGGNLNVTGNIVDTGALNLITGSNSNIGLLPNGTGNINTGSNIMPTANATANIGSTTLRYNTVFAQATSAQYADLAENYQADNNYSPGTVLSFGGNNEVTVSTVDMDPLVAGIVSTNPAYQMNTALTGNNVVPLALVGRVPCLVQGPVTAGAMMVSAGNGRARAEKTPAMGTVLGKALESFSGGFGTVEIVVGRL